MDLFERIVDSDSVPEGSFGRVDRFLIYAVNALSTPPAAGVTPQEHLLTSIQAMGTRCPHCGSTLSLRLLCHCSCSVTMAALIYMTVYKNCGI